MDDPAGARHDRALGRAEGTARDEARLRVSGAGRGFGGLADSDNARLEGRREPGRECAAELAVGAGSVAGGMADAAGGRHQPCERDGGLRGANSCEDAAEQRGAVCAFGEPSAGGPTNGLWADADWLFCRDGKWRPVETPHIPAGSWGTHPSRDDCAVTAMPSSRKSPRRSSTLSKSQRGDDADKGRRPRPRYPKDWPAISQRIRVRAGHRCEFCGIPDKELGGRSPAGVWHKANPTGTDGLRLTWPRGRASSPSKSAPSGHLDGWREASVLSPSGTQIWRRLDGNTTLDALADDLADTFQADRDSVASDRPVVGGTSVASASSRGSIRSADQDRSPVVSYPPVSPPTSATRSKA